MISSLRFLGFLRFARFVWFLWFLGLPWITPITAFADSTGVRGSVVDPAGAAVPGAHVIVTSQSEVVARVETDDRGAFELNNLPPKRYELRVVHEGFRATPVQVDLGRGGVEQVTLHLRVSALSEAVVVSAAEVDLPLSRTPASATVIARQDLSTFQLGTVAEALRLVPGLSLAGTGAEGAVTGLFSRGGESDFTAVAIDGVPVNAFGGGFNFGNLTTGDVERVEVIRGPQSALWSGAAIGGVVNVITQREARRAFQGSTSLGTRGGDRATASGVLPLREWRVSFGGDRQSSDGLNGRTFLAGRVTNDDWKSEQVSAGVRHDGRTRVTVTSRFEWSERGFPGAYGSDPGGTYTGIDDTSRANTDTSLAGASVSRSFARFRPSASVSLFRLSSDFVDSFGQSESGTRRTTARGETDILINEALSATAGVEWLQERATSTFITGPGSTPTPVKRSVASLFAEARYDAGRAFVTAGARLEAIRRDRIDADPNAFTPRPVLPADTVTAVTPRVSGSWFIRPASGGGDWTRLRASAGLGIRPPDAFELAFSNNPGLKPERTRSAEIGFEQAFARARVIADVTAFHNRYDDLIVTVGPLVTNVSEFQSDNISNARARGLETSVSARSANGFSATAGYTFLDTEVLALDRLGIAPPPFEAGDPLLRRPRHQGWVQGSWRGTAADVFVVLGTRGRILDVDPTFGAFGGLYTTPGYTTVSVGGAWHATRALQVFARVTNLLDRQYEEVLGFPAPPRSAYAGIRVDIR